MRLAKVLVTGGGGFIGSHVAEIYANQSDVDEVLVIDNLSRSILLNKKIKSLRYNWDYLHKYQKIKFYEKEIRPMGRQAAGVKGISLGRKDRIIGMVVIGANEKFIFTASERGYGKKTEVGQYPRYHRGGKGVINLKTSKKIGQAIGMVGINGHELLMITEIGKVIRIKTENVRAIGRATQGVRIINLEKADRVSSIAKVRES